MCKQSDTNNIISWENICSTWNIWRLNNDKFYFSLTNHFFGDTTNIGKSDTAKLITKVETYPDWSFFNWNLNVTVAKPTVSTFGWWASVLNWTNYSDIWILKFRN